MIVKTPDQDGISDLRAPSEQVLHLLENGRSYSVEELIQLAPDISWVQLFIAMDHLSRCGRIELRRRGFTYLVRKAESAVEGSGGANAETHPDHR